MTADMSVAPEIARLAEPVVFAPERRHAGPGARRHAEPAMQPPAEPSAQLPAEHATQILGERATQIPGVGNAVLAGADRLTLGTLARKLRTIAASPERWWGLVRFNPDRSVEIEIEDQPEYGAWLVIMPPGDTGRDCDCDVATVIAGAAIDGAPGGAVLRPGPTRAHGQRHRRQGRGPGYSISLHARARRPPPQHPAPQRPVDHDHRPDLHHAAI